MELLETSGQDQNQNDHDNETYSTTAIEVRADTAAHVIAPAAEDQQDEQND